MNKIDQEKYQRYAQIEEAKNIANEMENSQYFGNVSYIEADKALDFLKAHTDDNQFEREAATSAIIKAITFLEDFEKTLKIKMNEGIAEDKRKAEIAKKASTQARKIFNKKIEPAFKVILEEIENLNAIQEYSSYWLRGDFEKLVNQVKQSTKLY